jgi:argonaute-like protein implicated in RNA metabolism and viral defense
LDKDDRVPKLTVQQSYDLITVALQEYRIALHNFPARLVVHKSANFSEDEIAGIEAAAQDLHINAVDFVTVLDSNLRLFRDGNYPPFRGTLARIEDNRLLMYSRGSVWYYQTYPGMYIPRPIELRVVKSEVSPMLIAREALGLTKMNWNNTQFDGKYPVTLGCARKVGEVMKYLTDSETPQIRYGFYM